MAMHYIDHDMLCALYKNCRDVLPMGRSYNWNKVDIYINTYIFTLYNNQGYWIIEYRSKKHV